MRGRPVSSPIRQRIIDVLSILERATGYDIFKVYKQVYEPCSLRVIYYHLHKGVTENEFILEDVSQEKGDFSWGQTTQKIYYVLGPKADPQLDAKTKATLQAVYRELKQ